ncbi:MAG: phage minor capsid protein [Eubacterium sp.]
MLDPAYLMSVSDNVVEIYSQVEQDIASDIARRIVKNGYITDTAQWQLQKAKELGYFQKDIDVILSEATGLSRKEIKRLMNEAGMKSLLYDDAIYKAAGLSPLSINKSPAMMALLLQGTDKTLSLIGNYTKTTAKMSNLALNNILDRAFIQIISGAYSPSTAITNAVKEIASKGINKIAYPTGHYSSVEASVRRAVITGINQATTKLQLARMNEMQCELVETSSHAGARPTHAEWQGRVFCIRGTHPKYGDFYRETDYGSGEGLCGWNCYHSFYPYYEGLSTRTFSSDPSADAGRDNGLDYELQQKQRYYERKVREAKKECVTYNSAMQSTDDAQVYDNLYKEFQKSSVKLKNREKKLNDFLNENNKTRDRSREQSAGFDRSTSSKAVWANRKAKGGR